jgi:ABC-type amino acid transport substrate-binding protein
MAFTAAMRVDRWQDDTAWSPRASILFRASDRVAFTAAAYRAFRAPTLNELIRNFRVGNVLTLANDRLGPERLSAVEAGVRSGPFRATLFSMTTSDTIANVTLSTTPTLITRQRQNFGSSRSEGAEIDFEKSLGARWTIDAGWLTTDARLSTGKRPPQVPRHQATLQLRFMSLGAQLRWSAMQFDDDLNQLAPTGKLRGGVVAAPAASAFFAIRDGKGEVRGVTVDLIRSFAAALKLPLAIQIFENSGQVTDAVASGNCDVAFMPQDAERTKRVDFGPAYYFIESTYLVPAGSTINSIEATRGCPHKCDFCAVPAAWANTYAHRPVEEVVAELETFAGRHALFIDLSPVEDVAYAKSLYRAMIPLGIRWVGLATTAAMAAPIVSVLGSCQNASAALALSSGGRRFQRRVALFSNSMPRV